MDRREFLAATAAITAAAALPRAAAAQPASPPPVKTVRTPILEIGYHESGPADGFPVLLFHGFPDDAHAYDGVAPVLAKAGYRAFAIYLRGTGRRASSIRRRRAWRSRRPSRRTSSTSPTR